MVTFSDLTKIPNEERKHIRVKEVLTESLTVTYSDASVQTALDYMYKRKVGRLPVVDQDDPTDIIGIITRSDIVRAYELACTRS
ncbi:MAG: CBS domain-containing protein [Candidatus Bathyarchaeota archaeon]